MLISKYLSSGTAEFIIVCPPLASFTRLLVFYRLVVITLLFTKQQSTSKVTAEVTISKMFKSNFEKLLGKCRGLAIVMDGVCSRYVLSLYRLMFTDKVTSNLLLEPDWPSTLEICDSIRQKDVQ